MRLHAIGLVLLFGSACAFNPSTGEVWIGIGARPNQEQVPATPTESKQVVPSKPEQVIDQILAPDSDDPALCTPNRAAAEEYCCRFMAQSGIGCKLVDIEQTPDKMTITVKLSNGIDVRCEVPTPE